MKLVKVRKADITEEERAERDERKRLREIKDELNKKLQATDPKFRNVHIHCGISEMGPDFLNFYATLIIPGTKDYATSLSNVESCGPLYSEVGNDVKKVVAYLKKTIKEIQAKYPEVSFKNFLR